MKNNKRGFTLIELTISLVVLAILAGSIFGLVDSTGDAVVQRVGNATLKSHANRALRRITNDLVASGAETLQPLAPQGTSAVAFRRGEGISGTAITWGPQLQFRLVHDAAIDQIDGLDNDGNGLVDDGTVFMVRNPGPNEQRVVLLNNVPAYLEGELPNGIDDNGNGMIDEAGLAFRLDGDVLTIWLTVERRGAAGRIWTHTVTTSIRLRNSMNKTGT